MGLKTFLEHQLAFLDTYVVFCGRVVFFRYEVSGDVFVEHRVGRVVDSPGICVYCTYLNLQPKLTMQTVFPY